MPASGWLAIGSVLAALAAPSLGAIVLALAAASVALAAFSLASTAHRAARPIRQLAIVGVGGRALERDRRGRRVGT
jgi:hypothetical protein